MPDTHFVVFRDNWRPTGRQAVWVRVPGEVRMAAFPDREAAELHAAGLEADARRVLNPFHCGLAWADRSSIPELFFADFLRDADIDVPTGSWADWFAYADLTPAHRERVWEGLNKLRFYRVDERPVRPTAFAVVRVDWRYNDMWYYPDDEGGQPEAVLYRTRARAEIEAARLTVLARDEWFDAIRNHERYDFDMQLRRFPDQEPFDPKRPPPERTDEEDDDHSDHFGLNEVPFYEVIEVELEGDV